LIEKIIKTHASRAPFGKGTKTITDLEVRKVWQLSPDQFKNHGGKQWNEFFNTLLKKIKNELGLVNYTADLYKLLIYDKGGFFKPQRKVIICLVH